MSLYKFNEKQRVSAGVAADGKTYRNGQIVASRMVKGDPEPAYLIKFKGKGGLVHVTESNITA